MKLSLLPYSTIILSHFKLINILYNNKKKYIFLITSGYLMLRDCYYVYINIYIYIHNHVINFHKIA